MKLDLYFEGLMQSWRGAERGVTGDAPGKSALVGMIGRCMGVLRDDSFTITDTFAFKTTDIYKIVKKESITGMKRLVDDQIDFLHSVWPLYLGSSCCPPSGPIIRGDVY